MTSDGKVLTYGGEILTTPDVYIDMAEGTLTSFDSAQVQSLKTGLFWGCTQLSEVDCPNVSFVGYRTFYNNTGLTQAAFSAPSVSFQSQPFVGCTNLTTISMPNVTRISEYAFSGCTKLKNIYMDNVSALPTTLSTTFGGLTSGSVTVVFSTAALCTAAANSTYWSSVNASTVAAT